MIDTDKYEGHSVAWGLDPDDWTWAINMFTAAGKTNEADALLIQDAPLLLAEVKRLREMLYIAEQNIPRRIHWDCYVNALIEAGFEEGEEE